MASQMTTDMSFPQSWFITAFVFKSNTTEAETACPPPSTLVHPLFCVVLYIIAFFTLEHCIVCPLIYTSDYPFDSFFQMIFRSASAQFTYFHEFFSPETCNTHTPQI
jgi:hypothetical protein